MRRPALSCRSSSYAESAILALEPVLLDAADRALEHRAVAEFVEVGEQLLGLALHLVGERLDEVRPAERVGDVGDVGLVGDHLLRAQRDPCRLLGRAAPAPRPSSWCAATALPPSTPASASIAVRTMLTSGCCAVSDTPAVWVWNRSCIDRRLCGAVALLHPARPDAARGAVLGDLLEEVDVGVEEEAQPGRERRRPAGRPASASSTYANPLASVNASSSAAVEPASRMW